MYFSVMGKGINIYSVLNEHANMPFLFFAPHRYLSVSRMSCFMMRAEYRYLKVILDIQEIIHFYNEALNLNQICHLQKTMSADSFPVPDEICAFWLLDETSPGRPFCRGGDERITPPGHTLLLWHTKALSFPHPDPKKPYPLPENRQLPKLYPLFYSLVAYLGLM